MHHQQKDVSSDGYNGACDKLSITKESEQLRNFSEEVGNKLSLCFKRIVRTIDRKNIQKNCKNDK